MLPSSVFERSELCPSVATPSQPNERTTRATPRSEAPSRDCKLCACQFADFAAAWQPAEHAISITKKGRPKACCQKTLGMVTSSSFSKEQYLHPESSKTAVPVICLLNLRRSDFTSTNCAKHCCDQLRPCAIYLVTDPLSSCLQNASFFCESNCGT